MSATRAALHGTVTFCIVSLRVASAILFVSADVLRRIADVIAAGREAPKTSPAPDPATVGQLVL
jgi:hypothetical protein